MTEESLRDRRILIVEDEYMIAEFLQYELEDAGAVVAGMIGNVDDGLRQVRDGLAVDAAILDVNLGGQAVFPLADELAARGIPFVFTTGYDASSIPPRFKQVERYVKPYNTAAMLGGIARIIETAA
ncbi:response regulator [Bordetella genomosp. 5]|uniref:response regulator n=1 Tax=Bordetella genomosp. 5 TaxID=1395608 RepID=UPI000B9E88EC|nr:response regulator [Bordetella genomosp. 5]OZI43629.1 response regulator [Bordetella genomosp. 5]